MCFSVLIYLLAKGIMLGCADFISDVHVAGLIIEKSKGNNDFWTVFISTIE